MSSRQPYSPVIYNRVKLGTVPCCGLSFLRTPKPGELYYVPRDVLTDYRVKRAVVSATCPRQRLRVRVDRVDDDVLFLSQF